MNNDLALYYNERAKEYDKVYQIEEEQDDLIKATQFFQKIFNNKNVLEIACGTGYWTAQISVSASSIFATDINQTVLDIAKTRQYKNNVVFEIADMYSLNNNLKYDGIFGGFIWSHILLQNLDNLLIKLKELAKENCDIVFIDSKQVQGKYHDRKSISRVDEYGNTFQTRQLENGATYEVLKNFPANNFLIEKLSKVATDINIIELDFYWIAMCKFN